MKKIALCTETLHPLYGVEKRVYEMAKHLPRYGYDITLYTSSSPELFPKLNIKQISPPTITKPPRRNYLNCLKFWKNLYNHLMKKRYHIIDANGHLPLLPCSLAASRKGRPVIATIHDLYLSDWTKMYGGFGSLLGLPFELLSTKMQYNKIITLNTSLKKKMTLLLGMDPSKIDVIYSGIDTHYLDRIISEKKEKRIVYVGRLTPQKNIDILLKAYASLTEIRKDYELRIIGEGSSKPKLEKLARRLKIDVTFTGRIERHEDVIKEIKQASLFVLPSKRECFGITLLEAMYCGTPVISTATEGPMDYIVNGENGFLAEINDENDIAAKISVLLNSEKMMKRFSENGRKTAARFDWKNIIKEIAKVYKEFC